MRRVCLVVAKVYPTKILVMTITLVLVWMGASFLASYCLTANSKSFFLPKLANPWALKTFTKIFVSQIFRMAHMGSNQTYPNFPDDSSFWGQLWQKVSSLNQSREGLFVPFDLILLFFYLSSAGSIWVWVSLWDSSPPSKPIFSLTTEAPLTCRCVDDEHRVSKGYVGLEVARGASVVNGDTRWYRGNYALT